MSCVACVRVNNVQKHDMHLYVSFPFRCKQELLRCATLHKLYTQQQKLSSEKKGKLPKYLILDYPFKHRVKTHLPFSDIIRSKPYSPR